MSEISVMQQPQPQPQIHHEHMIAKLDAEIADCCERSKMSRDDSIDRLCEYYEDHSKQGCAEATACFELLTHCYKAGMDKKAIEAFLREQHSKLCSAAVRPSPYARALYQQSLSG